MTVTPEGNIRLLRKALLILERLAWQARIAGWSSTAFGAGTLALMHGNWMLARSD